MRHFVLGVVVLATIGSALESPPVPQPLAYHAFADQRTLLGIPHALNVLSNVPFVVVGLMGLVVTFDRRRAARFSNSWDRWPYAALFAGVTVTMVGSSYYHLAPDNARLVWDRLPMTVAFMGLLTALLAERVSLAAARWLFVPLTIAGAASVGYWHWTEVQGAGDLRPYAVVQFGSLALVVLILALYPSRVDGTNLLILGLIGYGVAKVCEIGDGWIYSLGHVMSGHTLKHAIAAAGVACIVQMLRTRGGRVLLEPPA